MATSDEPEKESEPDEEGTFPAEYVATLRREAAERRVAARGVLADPDDLLAYVSADELRDEDGNADPERIKAAAATLVAREAHLAPRTGPTGDADQGARPPGPPTFDLADTLPRAAG